MNKLSTLLIFTFIICVFFACSSSKQIAVEEVKTAIENSTKPSTKPVETSTFKSVPQWTKDKVLYEVNIRQYSEEGTFAAFQKDLPRLKKMGIDIIWLMPIHPIGKEKRKGSLGSYYAISDYKKVNPEFGTLQDFKNLVNEAHKLDMFVMLDVVANHTAWDNWLMEKHPDYYTRVDGKVIPPVPDWSDVADLNFEKEGLRDYLVESLLYWITECDVDGYRCDVAGEVPKSFWKRAKTEIDKVKTIFFLAEAEEKELHNAGFHMTYAWEFHHLLNQVAKQEIDANAIRTFLIKDQLVYGRKAYRLGFTSNHDENSWNGTVFDRMGDAHKCLAALTFFTPTMPLIYSGQEAPLRKKLEFFEKDAIDWNNYEYQKFYEELIALKKNNKALWNGVYGGNFKIMQTTNNKDILVIIRKNGINEIAAMFNLSNKNASFELKDGRVNGLLVNNSNYTLAPWEYKIIEKENN